MLTLFREGGFPMFFLLAFGLGALVFAARYALVPGRARLRLTLGLSFATAFTTLTGAATALSAVGHQAPDYVARHPGTTLPEVVLLGFAESMAPVILGFTTLSLVSLLVSVGLYREPVA